MQTPSSNKTKFVIPFLVGVVVGIAVALAFNSVIISMQPDIYTKLENAEGIAWYWGQWDSELLENRTTVNQYKNFDELAQIARIKYSVFNDTTIVELDRTNNVIWITDFMTSPEYIAFYFYTEPD